MDDVVVVVVVVVAPSTIGTRAVSKISRCASLTVCPVLGTNFKKLNLKNSNSEIQKTVRKFSLSNAHKLSLPFITGAVKYEYLIPQSATRFHDSYERFKDWELSNTDQCEKISTPFPKKERPAIQIYGK